MRFERRELEEEKGELFEPVEESGRRDVKESSGGSERILGSARKAAANKEEEEDGLEFGGEGIFGVSGESEREDLFEEEGLL